MLEILTLKQTLTYATKYRLVCNILKQQIKMFNL